MPTSVSFLLILVGIILAFVAVGLVKWKPVADFAITLSPWIFILAWTAELFRGKRLAWWAFACCALGTRSLYLSCP